MPLTHCLYGAIEPIGFYHVGSFGLAHGSGVGYKLLGRVAYLVVADGVEIAFDLVQRNIDKFDAPTPAGFGVVYTAGYQPLRWLADDADAFACQQMSLGE